MTRIPRDGSESWWVCRTREEFMAAHRQNVHRITTDKEGMRLVPLRVWHDNGQFWGKRRGFANNSEVAA